MNIVFMGTPEIAAVVLKKLIESKHNILTVVTQPDKPKGRGKQVGFSQVKEVALTNGIPILQPAKAREEEFIHELTMLAPDMILVVAFGQILPREILELPTKGCINVHASLLPRLRGAAPIQRAIMEGETKTGITIMHMDVGIDTGDMILSEEVTIDEKETSGTLHDKLAICGSELLLRAMEKIENGTALCEKQDDSLSTYARPLNKNDGNIDFHKSAIEIERLIRGLNPWPSAYTCLDGKTLKIWDADVEEDVYDGECGEIVDITKTSILVKTKHDILAIKELQLEGKKRMSVESFLRGYDILVGTKL